MSSVSVTLEVRGIPEMIQAARKGLAHILREEADAEASLYVRRRLREIAAAFEAGRGWHG